MKASLAPSGRITAWISALVLVTGLTAWTAYRWAGAQAERLALTSRLEAVRVLVSYRGMRSPLAVYLADYQPGSGLEAVRLSDTGEVLYIHPDPVLTGRDVASAQVSENQVGLPALRIQFTPKAAARLQAFSRQHLHERLVFMAGRQVLVAPVISAPITEDFTLLEGLQFTETEVRRLAVQVSGH